MTALLSLIASSPTLLAIGGGIIAVAVAWLRGHNAGAAAERNKQRAKEADSYEKHLEDLGKAAAAGGAVRPGDSLSDDPFNRDR